MIRKSIERECEREELINEQRDGKSEKLREIVEKADLTSHEIRMEWIGYIMGSQYLVG